VEEIFLPEDGPTEIDTNNSIADAEWVEQEARRADPQPGLVLWMDGSQWGGGIEAGMQLGWEEGPCGILSGGICRRGRHHCTCSAAELSRVRIFTDTQAVITCMTYDELGLGQTYGFQAIAALREREPSVEIEIRWWTAYKGIPRNEVADGWAK